MDRMFGNALDDNSMYEFVCQQKKLTYQMKSFSIEWQGKKAHAHLVADITREKQIESMAHLDRLTGLYNRWFAMSTLNEAVAKGEPFILCYIDLDNLKSLNDSMGHVFGDEYILSMVDCLKELSESGGTLCRIGGDEFLWIAEDATVLETNDRLEKLRREFVAQSKDYAKSFSYGVIRVAEDNTMSSGQLMDLADQKMYLYKQRSKMQAASHY